jgi:D-threo-aldose 1-dehydrogenase
MTQAMTTLPRRSFTTRKGRTLDFTRYGLGTAPLGNIYNPISESGADATFAAAWDAGIRYYDTAPLYGMGLAETRLNRALRHRPRDEYVLSTKVGRLLKLCEPEKVKGRTRYFATPTRDVVYDYSYDGIMRSFETSLERLGADRIDILYIHDIDPITHESQEVSEAHIKTLLASGLRALTELRSSGVVAAIGTGLNVWQVAERLVRDADLDMVLLAGRYTILEQEALQSFLPLCVARGVGVVVGGAMNSGILAGGTTYNYNPAPPDIIERVKTLDAVCKKHGVALTDAALQFPLAHPAVVAIAFGAVTAEEVRQNISTLSRPVPDALWAGLKAQNLLRRDAPVPVEIISC